MTGPYIIPIANGDLATDHVSYELITSSAESKLNLIQSFLNFALKTDWLRIIFECGQIPSAFRTRILERNTCNDANIIYRNYIWDIRILDSWIYVPLLGCGNVFSFDDVNK